MSGRETFDVSAKTKRILEFRAARRTQLHHDYLKQIGNPYRMAADGYTPLMDMGMNRFLAMRATAAEHFRPNPRNSLFSIFVLVVPIGLVMYFVIGSKNREEREYRTGQVSYRDRKFKFT